MIKIIKPGKIRIIMCPRCECQFSFEDADVKHGCRIELECAKKYGVPCLFETDFET